MRPLAVTLMALALAGCSAEAESGPPGRWPAPPPPVPAEVRAEADAALPGGMDRFADVLAQHQALNARVERVAHRVLTANAELCPRTHLASGLSVHTVQDYPEALRGVARHLLDVDDGVTVRSVVRGGPADEAGLEPGDAVREVGGMPISASVAARRYWDMAEDRELQKRMVRLEFTRDGARQSALLAPEPACDYPVSIAFSPTPNAFTDGERLIITSELVRRTETDSRLALILAHELAHAVAHMSSLQNPDRSFGEGRALELDADAKGLVMVARAGYDMDEAIEEMDRFGRGFAPIGSPTHPAHQERVEALRAHRHTVAARQATGRPLTLD